MAKGTRSKIKKRLRSLKRKQFWEVEGKQKLDEISTRLQNGYKTEKHPNAIPPNAFLHPDRVEANFPQLRERAIIEYRSDHLENSGLTAIGAYRKAGQPQKGKEVLTTAEVEQRDENIRNKELKKKYDTEEEEKKKFEKKLKNDEVLDISSLKLESLSIDKAKEKKKKNAMKDISAVAERSKQIKKKRKKRKNEKTLVFA